MAYPSVTFTFSNGSVADATAVNQNFSDIINGISDGTKDIQCAALTTTGNTTIGNASGDDLTVTASLASTLNIKTTNTYDIGSTSTGLRAIYFGANSQLVNIKASASMSATWTLTLPVTAGSASYALLTNGSGVTTWTEIPLFTSNVVIVKTGTGKGIDGDAAALIYIGQTTASGLVLGKSGGQTTVVGYLGTSFSTDSSTTGASASLGTPAVSMIRLTNSSLTSITMITASLGGQRLCLVNLTGNRLGFVHDTGATSNDRIYTPTAATYYVPTNSCIELTYDSTTNRWVIQGNSSLTNNILGSLTGAAPAAGFIGERLEATISTSGADIAKQTTTDLGSFTPTAGRWLIFAEVYLGLNSGTATSFLFLQASIGTAATTFNNKNATRMYMTSTSNDLFGPVTPMTFIASGGSAVYLNGYADFSTGTAGYRWQSVSQLYGIRIS